MLDRFMSGSAVSATYLASVCIAFALVAAPAPGLADVTPRQKIAQALIDLQSRIDVATRAMGKEGATDLGSRLVDDLEGFDENTPPSGFSSADWVERLRTLADLDASLVAQILAKEPASLDSARGLVERTIVSHVDGTRQQVALYVPATLAPHPALVVLLHGNPQTESEILAGPYFRNLADATGTIIAAPYGRGSYDFQGPAADDVYQAADEVASAFHIEPKHVFLVGYSMGGFSVFKIGPNHGSTWNGVMCISGAILNSETASVLDAFKNTPMYVVTGTNDQSIPSRYTKMTAQYLAGVGIPTSFYEEKNGTHIIATFLPSLTAAWTDMIHGVVRHTPAPSVGVQMPPTMPLGATLKP